MNGWIILGFVIVFWVIAALVLLRFCHLADGSDYDDYD
jgi:hypothetical protein